MALEERMKKICKDLKAPDGKFVVCVWNPSNPRKSTPTIVGRPYSVEGFAIGYAKKMNKKLQPAIGETEYFVVDDKGYRLD